MGGHAERTSADRFKEFTRISHADSGDGGNCCELSDLGGSRFGFDSHHSLHFQPSLATGSQLGFRPRTRRDIGRRWLAMALVSHAVWFYDLSRREVAGHDRPLPGNAMSILANLFHPVGVTLTQCDPFGIPSTSHWTVAAIIVQCSRTKKCIVTRLRTSPGPMPSSLAG
jgi:hypothetical protein